MTRKFAEFEAVAQLDLTVPVGTCLGLLGPNGAGKTTTIEMLVGLNRPDAGTIQILGKTYDEEATAIREQIGVQLQETHLPEKNTVFELLRLFRSFYPSGRELDEVVELIGLEEKRNARVESLSGGQRQRLSLGCALVHEPEVLFLDEPTTGLDPKARRTVWEVVRSFKEGGGTVLLTTHYMDEAEQLADQLVILDHGRILEQGAPARIVEQLGSDSIIEFSLQDGPRGDSQTLGVGDLLGLPGVLRTELRGASWSLSVRDVSQTLPPLFRLLESRGLVVGQVNNHRPTLDDVFVSLTGRHLQDGEGSGSPGAGADETAAPDS